MNLQSRRGTTANAPTRRQLVAGAVALSGLCVTAARARAGKEDHISHTAESIHQEPVFQADRKRVYKVLTDAGQFGQMMHFSGVSMSLGKSPTEISQQVGGAFVLFGGHIVGRHIELVPDERIVQAWRVVDWNPGVYSLAKFEFTEKGSGTRIVFDHTGFPEGLAQHLASGWVEHYWAPLAKYLA
jgi:activator of HSP90 ATPase